MYKLKGDVLKNTAGVRLLPLEGVAALVCECMKLAEAGRHTEAGIMEVDIWRSVLYAIAVGAPGHRELATQATLTNSIEFERSYAPPRDSGQTMSIEADDDVRFEDAN